MIEHVIPLIPILSIGYTLAVLCDSQLKWHFTINEKILVTIVLGTLSYVPILVILEIWKLNLFSEYNQLFLTIGFLLAIIWIYRRVPDFVVLLANFRVMTRTTSTLDKILIFIITFTSLLYIWIQLILPVRGYDALMLYLPESFLFYITDSIPSFDFLTFFPVYKEPLISLLYSFAYYCTKGPSIHLIPVLYLLGLFVAAYEIASELFKGDRTKGLLTVCFTATMPLTQNIVMNYAYYQDLFLSFFFSVTLLFYIRGVRNPKRSVMYSVLAGFSLALTVLSKVNGWSLFIIIPLITPMKDKYRFIQLILLLAVGYILSLHIATNVFVWFVPLIWVLLGIVGIAIYKTKAGCNHDYLLPTMSIGFLFGFHWLYGLAVRLPKSYDTIMGTYIWISGGLQWNFRGFDPLSTSAIFETIHGFDSIATCLLFFAGTSFTIGWFFPKLIGLIKGPNSEIQPIIIWFCIYWAIWLTYHGTSSIRYLTPIIIPVAILVVYGINELILMIERSNLANSSSKLTIGLVLYYLFMSPLSYYFIWPIDSNKYVNAATGLHYDYFLMMAVEYTINTPIVLIVGIFLSGIPIVFLLLRYNTKSNKLLNILTIFERHHYVKTGTTVGLTVLVAFAPFTVTVMQLVYLNFDSEEFEGLYAWHRNPEFHEIVEMIVKQNAPARAIVVVNMPGIHYLTNQPTVDVYAQSAYCSLLFGSTNYSETLGILQTPISHLSQLLSVNLSSVENVGIVKDFPFYYFIVPTQGNYWFIHYLKDYFWQYPFFRLLKNNLYFTCLLRNAEYVLYSANYRNAVFTGISDVYFQGTNLNASLLEFIECKHNLGTNISLQMQLDLSMVTNTAYNVTITAIRDCVTYFDNVTRTWTNIASNNIHNLVIDRYQDNSLSYFGQIVVNIDFINNNNLLSKLSYTLSSKTPIPLYYSPQIGFHVEAGTGYTIAIV